MASIQKLYTISGYYGSGNNKIDVFCAKMSDGLTWYVCDGAQTVNATYEDISEGANVEYISDSDCFTWPDGVESLEELRRSIEY